MPPSAADRAGEVLVDHLRAEADGLEDLGSNMLLMGSLCTAPLM